MSLELHNIPSAAEGRLDIESIVKTLQANPDKSIKLPLKKRTSVQANATRYGVVLQTKKISPTEMLVWLRT